MPTFPTTRSFVIVLCTTAEIVLLGVCPSRDSAAASSADAATAATAAPDELLLQPLPLYSLPTDNTVRTGRGATWGGL